jgi:hypothetical protein
MSTPVNSLLSMAKGRKALSTVFASNVSNSANPTSKPTLSASGKVMPSKAPLSWEQKAEGVRMWLKSNPLLLGVPTDGCHDSILSQLSRGDSNPGAQDKAWAIIVLELSTCRGIEALGFDKNTLNACIATIFANNSENCDPAASEEPNPTSPAVSETEDSRCEPVTENLPKSAAATGGGRVAAAAFAARESSSNLSLGQEFEGESADKATNIVPPLQIDVSIPVPNNASAAAAAGSKSAREVSNAAVAEGLGSISARGPGAFAVVDAPVSKSAPNSPDRSASGAAAKAPQTMMERQALWMAKKAAKQAEQKKAKADAEAASIVGKPKTDASRNSFKIGQAKAEALRKAAQEAARVEIEKKEEAEKAKKAHDSKWGAVKKNVKGGKKKSAAKKDAEEGAEGAEGAAMPGPPAGMISPTTAMAKRRSESACEVPAEAFAVAGGGGGSMSSSSSEPTLEAAPITTEASKEEVAADEVEFVEGSFFTRREADVNKGYFRVRSGQEFQMNSMYRKRDKKSGLGSSVALLVGKEEKWPNEEKTLEVIFDCDVVSEKKAFEWWQVHGDRFMSPRKAEGGEAGA